MQKPIVYSFVLGTMGDLMAAVEKLYFHPGMRIADVTYCHGRFWRGIDTSKYDFLPSDIMPSRPYVAKHDCRSLPYADESIDVVVFDPPFIDGAFYEKSFLTDTHDLSQPEVMQLYRDGMTEAKRVLRRGGLLLVKCMDFVKFGQQRSMLRVWLFATQVLGLIDEDRFCFVYHALRYAVPTPPSRHSVKRESYLWVFKKR